MARLAPCGLGFAAGASYSSADQLCGQNCIATGLMIGCLRDNRRWGEGAFHSENSKRANEYPSPKQAPIDSERVEEFVKIIDQTPPMLCKAFIMGRLRGMSLKQG